MGTFVVDILIGEISVGGAVVRAGDDEIRSWTSMLLAGSLLIPLETVVTDGFVFGVINEDCWRRDFGPSCLGDVSMDGWWDCCISVVLFGRLWSGRIVGWGGGSGW